ncbi:MAG: hypothetical protein AAFR71_11040 [Pseudomonadota bacterium]
MIQSAFLFAFGAFSAFLFCLLIAPAFWRRAVYLTQKRIESAVPLTVNELQADKDRLRAEHAIAIQKVEGTLKEQRAESARHASRIAELDEDVVSLKQTAETREKLVEELRAKLADVEGARLAKEDALNVSEAEKQAISADLAARVSELELTTLARDEFVKKSTSMEQKLTTTIAAEVKLRDTVEKERNKRRDEQEKAREARRELAEVALNAKSEHERAVELDKKLEKSITRASDLEEKLSRREKEIARLREERSAEIGEIDALERRAEDAEAERRTLEGEVAEMTLRVNRIAAVLDASDEPEAALEAMKVRIGQLEAELGKAKADLDQAKEANKQTSKMLKTQDADLAEGDNALREEMHQLAAQVLHMAALLEGDGSRVIELVGAGGSDKTKDGPLSLAERVVALRAASTPNTSEAVPSPKL